MCQRVGRLKARRNPEYFKLRPKRVCEYAARPFSVLFLVPPPPHFSRRRAPHPPSPPPPTLSSTMIMTALPDMHSIAHPQQRAFNPYTENGGTILAIAGADFAVIAGDTRQTEGYSIQTRYAPKVFRLCVHFVRRDRAPPK